MEYRMSTINVGANENAVEAIYEQLKENEGYHAHKLSLAFIAFEATAGTQFYLNNQKSPIEVPSSGSFVTPMVDRFGMQITSLKFPNGFNGNIFYIV